VGVANMKEADRRFGRETLLMLVILALSLGAAAQLPPSSADWQKRLRELVATSHMEEAMKVVDARLATTPEDLEAHGWRGRILAWKGRWPEAESEYRRVLQKAPHDVDILCALADVLFWQGKDDAALEAIDYARAGASADVEILTRRARILAALGRKQQARAQFREVLTLDPHNLIAKTGLGSLGTERKHDLRIGNELDTFNFTSAAQTQSLILNSHWTGIWSTSLTSEIYQRFGTQAQRFAMGSTFRLPGANWMHVEGAGANHHGIAPKVDASGEFGHSFRLHNSWVRGVELSYQQRWLWYAGAHVQTLSFTQLYYLLRDSTWSLTVTGARNGFTDTGIDWLPSGNTRLGFPLVRRLSGNLVFAVGSEDFAYVDQIGKLSAHTFGGGLRLRVASNQDLQGFISQQNRSQNRSQASYGVSYGIHF
jgi:tetratricopeptide (TPR) repeat protein